MGFRDFFARLSGRGRTINGPRRPWFFRNKTLVNEDSAMQVAAFNRGLIYISTQIAKLPWDVKDKNNNILDIPVASLLNLAPNDEMNAFQFKLFLIQQSIINGNSYAEIERNQIGTPIALWPLVSNDMELLRTRSGKLVYRYNDIEKGEILYEPRDIFHIKNFHTKDGLVGQGIVGYGREVLGIQIAADEMASGIFHNSGIPSGLLKHPGKLGDDAYKRLKESWANQQGGRKSGSTSILEEGMTYEAVNIDPEALQFIQSRKFGVIEIARFLGLPPTKLFSEEASTYSNTENANLEVATDTLDSWATNLEMEADVKILNYRYGGRYSDIDLYSIFRGDMKTRSDYFKNMISIAAMTPNQVRAREGLPGYGTKGDAYYIPNNNLVPVDRLNEVIDADIKQKTTPKPAPAAPAEGGNKALEEAAINYLTK